jgi:phytoene synthase
MDLSISRYQTWEDLSTYCYHTGGVVGLILCRILGLKTASAREHAVQMGKAVRLTEILRDVKADLQRGRIYLPQEDLERFGVSEASLRAETSDGSFHHLMQFQINRARMMYREASQGICQLPQDGSRLAASALAVMSAGILNLIERCNYDVFRHQVSLSPWQRLARLPLAWRLCRRNYDHPLPDVFAAG